MLQKLYDKLKPMGDTLPKTKFIGMVIPSEYSHAVEISCVNYKVDKLIQTKLRCLNKGNSGKIYTDICDFYEKDINKKVLVKDIKKKLENKTVLIEKTKDIKDICLSMLSGNSGDLFIRAAIIGCNNLETILYYMFRYAIVGTVTEKQSNEKYQKYMKDTEEYMAVTMNNMIGANINSFGVKNSMALRADKKQGNDNNSMALFEVATNLMFGNGIRHIKDRKKALDYYEKILSANDHMPLAHWGIAYMMLNYADTYKNKHPEWKERDKYIQIYEHARFAADLGCGAAYNLLGTLYNHMVDKKIDISIVDDFKNTTSTTYFKQSLECGYYFALNNLGKNEISISERASNPDEKREHLSNAYNYYIQMAEYAEPYACNMLGRMLIGEFGNFIECDRKRALEYWICAIQSDDIEYVSKWARLKIVRYFYNNSSDFEITKEQMNIISDAYEYIKNMDPVSGDERFDRERTMVLGTHAILPYELKEHAQEGKAIFNNTNKKSKLRK